MKNLKDNKYKESFPELTVEKLTGILEILGIEMEEYWSPENEIGTYSLRIQVKGSTIGSNGKGMSRAYARASAYAEFFERMQNVKLQPNATFYNYLRYNQEDYAIFPDEVHLTIDEWLKEDNSFCKQIKKELKLENVNKDEVRNKIRVIQKVDYSIFNETNTLLCTPYYSINNSKLVHIPYFSGNIHYGSNGMCAGNTPYEAISQGLSEVIERAVQAAIIKNSICIPDIPEEYLQKYPDIFRMYQTIKQSEKYNVLIKDCSLNKGYPAAALILIEKNTGKYGLKVGCSADYGIALERLFTEATQGVKLEQYARKTVFDFNNENVFENVNLLNGFRTGDSKYPYKVFSDKFDYEFTEPRDVTNMSNKEICNYLYELIASDGYEVLIRNVSNLGFPSYHIIVPGLSEMKHPQAMDYEADHTRFHVENLINNPEFITKENCKFVISVIDFYKNSLNVNKLRDLSGFLPDTDFPCKEHNLDNFYFAAMCCVIDENYGKAYKIIRNMNRLIFNSTGKQDQKYLHIENYLLGMCKLNSHCEVMSYLRKLYDKDECDWIHDIFGKPEEVLKKQYSSIDIEDIRSGRNKDCSSFYNYEKVCKKIKEAQKKNPIQQMSLEDILSDFSRR